MPNIIPMIPGDAASGSGGSTGSINNEIGFGMQMGGGILGFLANNEATNAQVQADVSNQQQAEQEAQYQSVLAGEQETTLANTFRQAVGSQRVAYAKAGIQLDTGVAAQMLRDSAKTYDQDKAFLLQNAGFKVNAANMKAQNFANQAANAKEAGNIKQGQTLMNMAGQVAMFAGLL
jgi:capsular polysaccharide biosynthesis protein